MKLPLTEDQLDSLSRERIHYYNELAPFSAYRHNLHILFPAPYTYKDKVGRIINSYPTVIALFTQLNAPHKRLELSLELKL